MTSVRYVFGASVGRWLRRVLVRFLGAGCRACCAAWSLWLWAVGYHMGYAELHFGGGFVLGPFTQVFALRAGCRFLVVSFLLVVHAHSGCRLWLFGLFTWTMYFRVECLCGLSGFLGTHFL